MHKLAKAATPAAEPSADAAAPDDAENAGVDETDVVSDELIQGLAWVTTAGTTKVQVAAWIYTKI